MVELETGRKIGEHRGLWFHTIGQRKGLGFGGGPWFVIKKDIARNILYVSNGYNPDDAYSDKFTVHDMHWLTLPLEFDGSRKAEITFKIRHTSDYFRAELEDRGDGTYTVHSSVRIHGVAPGQFCVIYDGHHHRCYGSAEITL